MGWDSLKVNRLCLREVNNCPWGLNTDGCNIYRLKMQVNFNCVRLVAFPPGHSSELSTWQSAEVLCSPKSI